MITNFKALSKNSLRKKALLIANAGYEAINIEKIVQRKIALKKNILFLSGNKINLKQFSRVFVLGIGKGSATASLSLAKILGKRLIGGIALDVRNPKSKVRSSSLKVFVGSHPLPSIKNVKATQEIIKLVESLGEKDLLITFICGGGSALLCGSEKEMKSSIFATKKLTEVGANIIELNTIRKHLSEVKSGGLAKLAYPAQIVSLIVSDVLGNDLSMVASGPTTFDKTTKKDAEKVWKRYFKKSPSFELLETPKDKKYFEKVKNILFVSNKDTVLAMAKKAKQLKLKPKIYSLKLRGEAKNAMILLMRPLKKEGIILAGGETTVKIKNPLPTGRQEKSKIKIGKGGRNQEAVLGALTKMIQDSRFKIQDFVFLSFASDGHDNTEAAGAIGDYLTIEKAKKLKLDPKKYLDNHDSFNFFKKTGDLIYADKTSFNVSDLMIVLKK